MKKVLMLATTAAMIAQFNKNNILILEEMGYEIHVAGNFLEGNPIPDENLEEFKIWLEEHHGKWFHIPLTRKPTDYENFIATYKIVLKLIEEYKYEFIHCHTPIGSVVARMAAHKTKTKIIYTAHGFHFFDGAPFKNWMLYYPIERFLSRWTDILVLINSEDFNRAKKSFHAKNVQFIPGAGIDVATFQKEKIGRAAAREIFSIEKNDFIIVSVGEINKNKNHEVIVRAIAQLGNPNIHYYIAGQGNLRTNIQLLAEELGINGQIHLLGYCENVKQLYECADVFAFPSRREGLGLAAIEAMSAGLPLLTSNVQGINDYCENGVTGYKYSPNDINGFAEGIENLIGDEAKRHQMGIVNQELAWKYDCTQVNMRMKSIYNL